MKSMSPSFVAAFVFVASAVGQDVVLLPAYTPRANPSSPQFRFAAALVRSPQLESWCVPGLPRRYFDEVLPALFERTLVIERLEAGSGRLEWIFTGELGGFTVAADSYEVSVSQRYYDSFGYGTPQPPLKHPEKIVTQSKVAYRGELHAVTVRLDSRLGLEVSLNGKEVLRQNCLLDVNRHQLAWTGTAGETGGYLLMPETAEASVEVDAARRHQTMLGFGGITTPTAYAQLSPEGKRRWWQILAEYNLLLHREYPIGARLDRNMENWDRMGDAMPHYYGDNFPNGEVSDFSYTKNVRRLGGKVLFEFWALPPWARRDWTDPDGKSYAGAAEPEAYAQAMVRYCQVARERTGVPPDIVGIQNEVIQPAGIWHQMALRLREQLNRAGFSGVAIHLRDSGTLTGGISCARAFLGFDAAWKAIDYSATHMYDYQMFFHHPDDFDKTLAQWHELTGAKPFLSTELSVNSTDFQMRSYRLALAMGQLYHKNLTLADAAAILFAGCCSMLSSPLTGGHGRCLCRTRFTVLFPLHPATRRGCLARSVVEFAQEWCGWRLAPRPPMCYQRPSRALMARARW
jgi:hypothetical protein